MSTWLHDRCAEERAEFEDHRARHMLARLATFGSFYPDGDVLGRVSSRHG